jgi:molybdopterin/thiamine biosynthesis adenylyltransferase
MESIELVACSELPSDLPQNKAYRLLALDPDEGYYAERTDRNFGWITRAEQEMLRGAKIGVSGCGGMGGQIAEKFIRLGVGHLRICDSEVFDVSNINRQFGATRRTVGVSKAAATARFLREVTDDFELHVYPQGITEETVDMFLEGCDVVCDEIEFWAVGARVLLHERARRMGIPVFNCNTIGFSTRLFLFTPESATMEDCLGLSYAEAKALQAKVQSRTGDPAEIMRVLDSVFKGLLPEFPEYCGTDPGFRNVEVLRRRLFEEGKASIIATNPPMATGFIADHVLLYLLRNSGVKRDVIFPPPMPGYLLFDAAKMEAKIVTERWW